MSGQPVHISMRTAALLRTKDIGAVLRFDCQGGTDRAAEGARGDAQVQWITFHSGYDFGYLLKVLTCQPLPPGEAEFFELLQVHAQALKRGFRVRAHILEPLLWGAVLGAAAGACAAPGACMASWPASSEQRGRLC